MEKIIMHYDMDAFYASIEINRNPKLKNKPLVVGENIVTTASYEARKFGIHSAMKVSDAKLLCPKLIVIPVDKTEYIRISNEIHNLIFKITNKVEFVATDEGYIDLTNLTCSVGIGFNKLSAKIASDINKPFGFFIFENEEEFIKYISDKKIKIIPGVGKKFYEILKQDKIFYVKDVFEYSLDSLVKKYGKSRGENLYCSVRGIDYDEVEYQREIHSIGNEETFLIPLQNNSEIIREFNSLFNYTFERLMKNNVFTQSVTIKMRYISFKTYTKSKKLKFSTRSKDFLYNEMLELINSFEKEDEVRLLGVYFGDIKKSSLVQLPLNKNL